MSETIEIVTTRTKMADAPDALQQMARGIAEEYGTDPDTVEIVRKGFVSVKEPEISEGERAVVSTVSSNAVDRDSEVMLAKGADLKWFRKNPVVLYGHGYSALPIGRAAWIRRDGNTLKAKTIFASAEANPVAEQVYNLFKEKILKAWSVGFIVLDSREAKEGEYEQPVRRVITKWALLEYSAVPVPSNMEALTTAIGKGLKLSDEVKKDLGITITIAETAPKEDVAESDGEKETFECECLDCGHTTTIEEHCNVTPCPECGGAMRRAERPGPGQRGVDGEPTIADLDVRMAEIVGKINELMAKLEPAPEPAPPTISIVPSEPKAVPAVVDIPADFAERLGKAVKTGMLNGITEATERQLDKRLGRVREL